MSFAHLATMAGTKETVAEHAATWEADAARDVGTRRIVPVDHHL